MVGLFAGISLGCVATGRLLIRALKLHNIHQQYFRCHFSAGFARDTLQTFDFFIITFCLFSDQITRKSMAA